MISQGYDVSDLAAKLAQNVCNSAKSLVFN